MRLMNVTWAGIILGLAACGGGETVTMENPSISTNGGNSDISPDLIGSLLDPDEDQSVKPSAETLAQALNKNVSFWGNETRRFTSTGYITKVDEASNGSTLSDVQNVSFKIRTETNGDKTFLVDAFDQKLVYTGNDDIKGYGFEVEIDGDRYWFISQSDYFVDIFGGTSNFDYLFPVSLGKWEYDGTNWINNGGRLYTAFGLETQTENMPKGKAEFAGLWRGQVNRTYMAEIGTQFKTIAQLDVDFTNSTASGSLTEYSEFDRDESDWVRVGLDPFLIDEASINANGFSSTISVDCQGDCPTVKESSVDINFYGPNAEEAGGSIVAQIDYSEEGDVEFIFNGAISAKQ